MIRTPQPQWLLMARKPIWRTLRFRLMLWNAIVVLLTATVTLVGLRQGVQYVLLHELDQILTEDIQEIQLALAEPGQSFHSLEQDLNRKALGHIQHGWFVQFLSREGEVVWASDNTPDSALLPPQGPKQEFAPVTANNYRLVTARMRDPEVPAETIRVGALTDPMKRDLERIDKLILQVVLVVFLLGPLFGYWLAGRATQPVAKMIQTASRLRPEGLEERLNIRGTGDELDQLAITVNDLLDRILAYLQYNRDFLANAAHELRTPLAAIRGLIEVALISDRSLQEYQELLEEIVDETHSLEILVTRVLLLSEVEADRLKVHHEPVDLDRIVARSLDMFAGVAESQEIQLTSNLEPTVVEGNSYHLRQVINNLMDNAVKYTPPGGTIDVQIHSHSEPAHTVELTVSDTGPGIPEEHQHRIFERFYRVEKSRDRKVDSRSTGLGLSICDSVVKSMGGTIEVQSRPGQGTAFHITLPAAKR